MNGSKDRTSEFGQIINFLKTGGQKSKPNGYSQSSDKFKSQRMKLIQKRAKFTESAKSITNNISNTCMKLETLNNLIKTSTLFDDKSENIQNLSNIIKGDLIQLTNEIKYLSDQYNVYGNSRQMNDHSASIVDTMQKKVKKMSNNFDGLLHCQLETLKRNAEKRDIFVKPLSNGSVNKGFNLDEQTDSNSNQPLQVQPKLPSFLLEDEEQSSSDHQDGTVVTSRSSGVQSQFLQQVHLIDRSSQYVESRSASIRQVESTIVDMGVIFKQLSQLIHEQGDQVQSIDSAVEETALNVESGHNELLKFYQSVSSNRWLMIKIFGILIIFVILFVVLLA